MPNLSDQTIVLNLSGSPIDNTTPPLLIPCHSHRHKELSGLGEDDHPQYLTVDRGISLFTDLFGLNPTEGQNIGTGVPIFQNKEGITLKFKTIVPGNNVIISEQEDTITIESIASGGGGGGGPVDGGTF